MFGGWVSRLLNGVVLALAVLAFFRVPFGRKTLAQHARAIFTTPSAEEAGSSLRESWKTWSRSWKLSEPAPAQPRGEVGPGDPGGSPAPRAAPSAFPSRAEPPAEPPGEEERASP